MGGVGGLVRGGRLIDGRIAGAGGGMGGCGRHAGGLTGG